MTAIVLLAQARRLDATNDPPGSWREVKSGAATFTGRVLTYDTVTIISRGVTVP